MLCLILNARYFNRIQTNALDFSLLSLAGFHDMFFHIISDFRNYQRNKKKKRVIVNCNQISNKHMFGVSYLNIELKISD